MLSRKQLMGRGYRVIVPLMVGVTPFGVVFGALAAGAGLSVWQALGMSILVIAGSSQFVAVGLIADSTPLAIIIFTTFIINLRHFLYSASLAKFFRPFSFSAKLVLGYFMIDEVYAAVLKAYQERTYTAEEFRWYYLGAGINLATLWWATTVIGWLLGNVIPASTMTILAFTLPLIFTSIVVPLLTSAPKIGAALSASVTGIILAPLPNNLNLIVAAAVGIAVGVLAEQYLATAARREVQS